MKTTSIIEQIDNASKLVTTISELPNNLVKVDRKIIVFCNNGQWCDVSQTDVSIILTRSEIVSLFMFLEKGDD